MGTTKISQEKDTRQQAGRGAVSSFSLLICYIEQRAADAF
jgi:hypothetical protein